jgi:glycosyltransferase involved in cell wall biosynthesis
MTRGAVVYDTDGLNPYGRELAHLLAQDRSCEVVCAADAEWLPPGVRCRPVLPGNRGGRSQLRQLLSLLHGLVITCWACRPGAAQLVVVFARTPLEELVFSLLSRIGGSVVLLVHEPTPRTPPSRLGAWTRQALLSSAHVVVHSEALRQEVMDQSPHPQAQVCRHLPYERWPVDYGAYPTTAGDGRVRVLLLGQVRPDKGLRHLPETLALLPGDTRARLVLRLCGKGVIEAELGAALRQLVQVEDETGPTFRTDAEVARAIAASHLLLAPYEGASQSGTITLALSCGLPVLAFDDGSISDLVSPEGLVPSGNCPALAAALQAFVDGTPVGRPRDGLESWRQETRDQWVTALREAARRG